MYNGQEDRKLADQGVCFPGMRVVMGPLQTGLRSEQRAGLHQERERVADRKMEERRQEARALERTDGGEADHTPEPGCGSGATYTPRAWVSPAAAARGRRVETGGAASTGTPRRANGQETGARRRTGGGEGHGQMTEEPDTNGETHPPGGHTEPAIAAQERHERVDRPMDNGVRVDVDTASDNEGREEGGAGGRDEEGREGGEVRAGVEGNYAANGRGMEGKRRTD